MENADTCPSVVILSSKYDFTCDYIVAQLLERDVSYIRLNSEDLSSYSIHFDPIARIVNVITPFSHFVLSPECIKSFYFRRPVFLRDYGDDKRSLDERFSRIQWSTFIRSLVIFNEACWINDPVATYRAEHKAMQLYIASELGFTTPETVISNSPHPNVLAYTSDDIIVKGLDTVLMREDGMEMFGYTNIEKTSSLEPTAWNTAPAIFQQALMNKLDIRVTVIGNLTFSAAVTCNGSKIEGDWRAKKREAKFSQYELPEEIAEKCCSLVRKLGLRYGAIDLALQDGEYFFLEINPTGEWAWLVDSTGMRIDSAITDALIYGIV